MTETAAAPIALDSFGITDKGKVRPSNQDNFLIVAIRKSIEISHSSLSSDPATTQFGTAEAHLFVVADGVGGGPAGDRASSDTVAALLQYVREAAGCFHQISAQREHELFSQLEKTVREVHQNLLASHSGGEGSAPATTLTMVLLAWPRAYFIQVGDSRAYVRRRGRLQQLTRDQTLGEYMVSVGAMTEEQAAKPGPAASLTSAIGGSELSPVVGLIDLDPGDGILLCTDGLTRHVSDQRITEVLGEAKTAKAAGETLLADALAGGGRDNVTLIVVKTAA
jgi:serine/threonine protein phosphatase PrpC